MYFQISKLLEEEATFRLIVHNVCLMLFYDIAVYISMSSLNILNYIAEKFYSFSSKMKGDNFTPVSASCLMNTKGFPLQLDLPDIVNEIAKQQNTVLTEDISDLMPLLRPFGLFKGLKSFSNSMDKPAHFPGKQSENCHFSSHIYDLILESYRYRQISLFDSYSISLSRALQQSMLDDFEAKNLNRCSSVEKKPDQLVMEVKSSQVNDNHSLAKKESIVPDKKNNMSHSLRLNLELTHRKTKELNKRSKKRRRRQKKIENSNVSNSASASDDDNECGFSVPVTRSVCVTAERSDFTCTVSLKHTVKMSPKNTFLIPVESDSNDDHEWETLDETDFSTTNNFGSDSNILSSSADSSPVKASSRPAKSSESFSPVKCDFHVSASVMSFIVPEEETDDDSDWDTYEVCIVPENADFGFTGLFVTDLFPQTCNNPATVPEECAEVLELRAALLKVNQNWNESTKHVDKSPKSPSKVKFASDEELVEVFPVEMYERKGEWEIYAVERLRFKRKIDELEKVLSPCLHPEHRSKIFKKLVEPQL